MGVVTDNSQTLLNALARIEALEKELADFRAEGMPADREELQKLLNATYRKGNQDAHAARDILVKLVPTFDEFDFVGAYGTDHIRDIAKMANEALVRKLNKEGA